MMPGKVTASHQKYETDCKQCHESFNRQKQTRLCRQCHKEIDKDINKQTGYHGRIANISRIECNTCHTEHRGRTMDIVKLDKQAFDHKLTDFPLEGKHRTVACTSCHKPAKKYRKTANSCYSCHKESDAHKGQLGKKCQQCHTEKNWLKVKFDHNKTDFKLTGEHQKNDCDSCHINQNYENTPTECVSCHITQDIHAGKFGKKCHQCHQTEKWSVIVFDHDKQTKFRLRGNHRNTNCDSCHNKNPYLYQTGKKCISCHRQDDIHRETFGNKCHKCHQEKGWLKNTFKHNRDTSFAISNKHAQVNCIDCHQANPFMRKADRTCHTCHKTDDIHKGSQGKQCDNCHNDSGWTGKVAFDHDLSDFPLIGLHASVSCDECHIDSHFKKTPSQCYSCHQDNDFHKQTFGKKCQECHNPNAWSRWSFDHNRETDFQLQSSHNNLECHACHLTSNGKDLPPQQCNACHATDDIHNGNFGIQCDRCHRQDSFSNIKAFN